MRHLRVWPVIGSVLFIAAFGLITASPALASSVRLHANLSGSSAYPNADGDAHYMRCCGHRVFDADLSGISSLRGKTLTVYAGGHRVGTMKVRSDGRCHLHHDTDDGQYVPTLSAGDVVKAVTGDGTLVASGTLRRMMM